MLQAVSIQDRSLWGKGSVVKLNFFSISQLKDFFSPGSHFPPPIFLPPYPHAWPMQVWIHHCWCPRKDLHPLSCNLPRPWGRELHGESKESLYIGKPLWSEGESLRTVYVQSWGEWPCIAAFNLLFYSLFLVTQLTSFHCTVSNSTFIILIILHCRSRVNVLGAQHITSAWGVSF